MNLLISQPVSVVHTVSSITFLHQYFVLTFCLSDPPSQLHFQPTITSINKLSKVEVYRSGNGKGCPFHACARIEERRRCGFTLSLTSAIDGWGVNATILPLYVPEMTRYPPYRRLGGPQGRSRLVR